MLGHFDPFGEVGFGFCNIDNHDLPLADAAKTQCTQGGLIAQLYSKGVSMINQSPVFSADIEAP